MPTALRAFVVVPVCFILFASAAAAFAQINADEADDMCPPVTATRVYKSYKPHLAEFEENGKKYFNLYGTICKDIEGKQVAANGICIDAHVCQAKFCGGKPCELPPIKVEDVKKAVYGDTPPPAVVPPPSLSDTGDVSGGLPQNPVPPANTSLLDAAVLNPIPLDQQKVDLAPSTDSFKKIMEQGKEPGVIDKLWNYVFEPNSIDPAKDTFKLQPTKYDDFGNEIPQTVGPKTDSFTGADSTFPENKEQMQLTETSECDSWMCRMREKVSTLFNPNELEEASLKKLQTNWNFGNMKSCSGGVCSGYQSFATPEEGARADINNIAKWVNRGDDTLNKLMNRLSPQSDGNDTRGMVNYLSDKLGISPNEKLDIGNETQMVNLFNQKTFLEHSKYATDLMPSRDIINAYQSVAQRYGFESGSQVPLPQSNPLVGGSYSYGPGEASGFDNLAAYNYFNDDNTAMWAEVARTENLASDNSLSGGRVGAGDEDIVFAGPTATEIPSATKIPDILSGDNFTEWAEVARTENLASNNYLSGDNADAWSEVARDDKLATNNFFSTNKDTEWAEVARTENLASNNYLSGDNADIWEQVKRDDQAVVDEQKRDAELQRVIFSDQAAYDEANKQTALNEESARQQVLNDERLALEDRKVRADEETAAYQKSLKDAESKVPVPDIVVVDAQKSAEEANAADQRARDAKLAEVIASDQAAYDAADKQARDEKLAEVIRSDQAAYDEAARQGLKEVDQKVLDSIKKEQAAAQAAVDAAQKRLDAANNDAQIAELTGGRQCIDTGFIECPATAAARQLAVAKDRLETVKSNYELCQAGNCPGSIVEAKAQAEKGQGATSAWFKAAEESFAKDLSMRISNLRNGTLLSPIDLSYTLTDGLGYAATWGPRTLLEGTTVGEYLGFRGTPDEVIGNAVNPGRELEDKITAGRDIAMITVPVAADLSISSKGFSALGNWTTAGREAGALGTDLAPAAGAVERELGVVGSEKSWLQSTREYFGFGEKPSTPTALTQAERDALVAGDQGPVIEPKVKTGSPDVNITKPEIAMGDEGAIPQKIPTPIEPVAVEKPSLLERWFGKSEPPAAVETPKAAVAPEVTPPPKVAEVPPARIEPTPPEITPAPNPVESAPIAAAEKKTWGESIRDFFGLGKKEPIPETTLPKVESAPVAKSELIADVKPIEQSGINVKTRTDLESVVERPLLKASEDLYDKNIRTLETSANVKNIKNGDGFIAVDYDSLSASNKAIAKELGDVTSKQGMNRVTIKIPISEQSTVAEIEAYSKSIADKFQKQELTWGGKTEGDLRAALGANRNDTSVVIRPEDYKGQFYYDPRSKLYYDSEELLLKANPNALKVAEIPPPRVEPAPPEITPAPTPVEPAPIAFAAEKKTWGDSIRDFFGIGKKEPIPETALPKVESAPRVSEPVRTPTEAELDRAAAERMAGEGPTPVRTPAAEPVAPKPIEPVAAEKPSLFERWFGKSEPPAAAETPKAAVAPEVTPTPKPAEIPPRDVVPPETTPPARPTTEPAPVEPVKRGSGDVSKPDAEIAMGDEGPVALKPGAENPSGKVWNDKTLTRDEFIADYKAVYPKTTLTDAQLAERYAAGKRLNPQTGQLKVPETSLPAAGTTPAGTPAAPAVAGTPSLLSRATSWMGDNKIKTMWIAVGGLVVGNTAREIYNMFTYSSPPENKTPAAPVPPVVAPPAPEAEVPPPPVVRKDVVLPPVTRRDVVATGYPDNSNTGGENFCISSIKPVVVIPNTQPGPGCYNNPGGNSAWRTFPPMPPPPPPTPTTPTPTKPPVTPAPTPTPTPTPTTTPPVLKPYATLIANPSAVSPGGKSRLIWSSVNTSSCELFAPGSISMATSTRGSTSTLPLATTTQFVLNCSATSGATTSAQTTVTVH